MRRRSLPNAFLIFATKPPSRRHIFGSYESNGFMGRGCGGWVAGGNTHSQHPGFVFVSRYINLRQGIVDRLPCGLHCANIVPVSPRSLRARGSNHTEASIRVVDAQHLNNRNLCARYAVQPHALYIDDTAESIVPVFQGHCPCSLGIPLRDESSMCVPGAFA
jgi:hypothetical protein